MSKYVLGICVQLLKNHLGKNPVAKVKEKPYEGLASIPSPPPFVSLRVKLRATSKMSTKYSFSFCYLIIIYFPSPLTTQTKKVGLPPTKRTSKGYIPAVTIRSLCHPSYLPHSKRSSVMKQFNVSYPKLEVETGWPTNV